MAVTNRQPQEYLTNGSKEMKNDKRKALQALTCAAMGLPGMITQSVSAETPPDKTSLSYRYTEYSEADQPASAFSDSVPRYDIEVHQFLITGAASENKGYSVAIGTESMSGASPWFIFPGVDGEPIQIMSGATIDESRTDFNGSFDFYFSGSKLGIGAGHSTENDYRSFSFAINNSLWFNDKNTTLDLSLATSFDTIEPTDAGVDSIYPLRPTSEDKTSLNAAVGMSHVINKKLLLGASVNYAVYDGYLSDPYKQVYVAGNVVGDSRPDVRKQIALNLQARRFFSGPNAALHADYRYFSTDWGTTSHTVNVAWYQNLGSWQIVPRIRFYNQSAANFYRNYYINERADGFYSSDYRLSAYDAISFRIKATKAFGSWDLHASYENYESSGSGSDPIRGENPGLVDFSFISIGANFRW